jgi:PGF-pre-PGF domain-containing protein
MNKKFLLAAVFFILFQSLFSAASHAATTVVYVSGIMSWKVAGFSAADVTYPNLVSLVLDFSNNGTVDLNVSGNLSIKKDGSAVYDGAVLSGNVSKQQNRSFAFSWAPSSSGDFLANLTLNITSIQLGQSNQTFAVDSFTVYSSPPLPSGGGVSGTYTFIPNMTGTLTSETNDAFLAVTKIIVYLTEKSGHEKLELNRIYGKPTLSGKEPPGEVYQYIEVKHQNIGDNIRSAVIYFMVESKWVSDNRIDKSTISLNRYSESAGKWESFTPALLKEDSGYLYCNVSVPSLSIFSISGMKKAECAPHEKMCNGSYIQECSEDGEWQTTECGHGCDASKLSCVPVPACRPQEMRCSGDVLQECAADGFGWETVETCKYGCWDNECKGIYVSFVTKMAVFVMTLILFAIVLIMVALLYMNLKAFTARRKRVTYPHAYLHLWRAVFPGAVPSFSSPCPPGTSSSHCTFSRP